ncbi:hypothetical protein ABW17_29260 [Mycobacterium nebraskense]|nr:hypothetical protein ABW17_29260 [Mycobacterium nebraskense]
MQFLYTQPPSLLTCVQLRSGGSAIPTGAVLMAVPQMAAAIPADIMARLKTERRMTKTPISMKAPVLAEKKLKREF